MWPPGLVGLIPIGQRFTATDLLGRELTLVVGWPETHTTAVTPVLQHLGIRSSRRERVGDGRQ